MPDFITALALAMVIEGSLYALFPEAMQGAMRSVIEQPPGRLRVAGVVAASLGVGIVWLVRGG